MPISSKDNRKALQVVGMVIVPDNKTSKAKRKVDAKNLYYSRVKEKQEVIVTNVDLTNNLHKIILLTWL